LVYRSFQKPVPLPHLLGNKRSHNAFAGKLTLRPGAILGFKNAMFGEKKKHLQRKANLIWMDMRMFIADIYKLSATL